MALPSGLSRCNWISSDSNLDTSSNYNTRPRHRLNGRREWKFRAVVVQPFLDGIRPETARHLRRSKGADLHGNGDVIEAVDTSNGDDGLVLLHPLNVRVSETLAHLACRIVPRQRIRSL